MSILSDREIVARCTKPTGHMVPHDYEDCRKKMPGYDPRINVVKVGDNFFDQFGRAITRIEDNPSVFVGRTGVLSSPYRAYVEGEIIGDWQPMIEPFSSGQVAWKGGHLIDGPEGWEDEPGAQFEQRSYRAPMEKIISYGTSSYGYDIRCGNQFKVFTNVHSTIVDPKNFDPHSFVEHEGDSCIIPPNSFALASSIEYLRIPRNILAICLGKSTYARCGIIVNVTPLEPEWEGHVTLEFSNTTNLPAKIYANEGVAQLLFLENERVNCRISYKDRQGKYMNQAALPVPPRM